MACELLGKHDGTDLLGSGRSVHAEPHPARLHAAEEMIVEIHVVVLGKGRGVEGDETSRDPARHGPQPAFQPLAGSQALLVVFESLRRHVAPLQEPQAELGDDVPRLPHHFLGGMDFPFQERSGEEVELREEQLRPEELEEIPAAAIEVPVETLVPLAVLLVEVSVAVVVDAKLEEQNHVAIKAKFQRRQISASILQELPKNALNARARRDLRAHVDLPSWPSPLWNRDEKTAGIPPRARFVGKSSWNS